MGVQTARPRHTRDQSQLGNAIGDFVYLRNIEDKTLWMCVRESERERVRFVR